MGQLNVDNLYSPNHDDKPNIEQKADLILARMRPRVLEALKNGQTIQFTVVDTETQEPTNKGR
jgi:hypothetical protein